jgi:tetratricopeptide (TPR) repeat protein
MTRHLWISAPGAEPELPLLARVDAHRGLRGPYTAAGSLVRALAVDPELLARHDVEVLTVAPELRGNVTCTRETLTSLAPPEERTRFYPPARTQRIAHGLTELLRDFVAGGPRRALVIERADAADPTDVEWIATLLRRIDPAQLQIVVCAGDAGPLTEALRRYADRGDGGVTPGPAADYVASDGTDDRLRAAYDALPEAERAARHDARADELERRGELTLTLGAIPYHRERGSDPRGAGARAVLAALEHCMLSGFYDAVLDLAHRSYALLDWETEPEECWRVTSKLTMALAAMGRADEAGELYDHACTQTTLPKIHLHAAYGRAMLHTRFYPPERRDRKKAKAHINTAIALSTELPDAQRRAFDLSFNENGLALIETYLGDPEKALALVAGGIERVESELSDERLLLHRSVLRYNRAQLLSRMGRPEEALAGYSEAIEADPNQSEYHLERGHLLRRLGHLEEALADYDEAIRTSPPYPEPHLVRADLALELGDAQAALAGLSYALELDPGLIDARVGRASLLVDDGQLEAARIDVVAGLALDPEHAELHALHASIAQQEQRFDEAHDAYAEALRHDPTLAAAWSNRATLWYEQGEIERAVHDLKTALELDDDPDIRANLELATAALR